jgi:hypothetical protein
MTDASIVGTQKLTAQVEAWHDGRTPDDGDPDEIVSVDVYIEANGDVITDQTRIELIRAAQANQTEVYSGRE